MIIATLTVRFLRTCTDFAKLYLESYMVHFNAFDDHLSPVYTTIFLARYPFEFGPGA